MYMPFHGKRRLFEKNEPMGVGAAATTATLESAIEPTVRVMWPKSQICRPNKRLGNSRISAIRNSKLRRRQKISQLTWRSRAPRRRPSTNVHASAALPVRCSSEFRRLSCSQHHKKIQLDLELAIAKVRGVKTQSLLYKPCILPYQYFLTVNRRRSLHAARLHISKLKCTKFDSAVAPPSWISRAYFQRKGKEGDIGEGKGGGERGKGRERRE